MTDNSGCDTCHGIGEIGVGRSGRDDDGDAIVYERCPECGYGADDTPEVTDNNELLEQQMNSQSDIDVMLKRFQREIGASKCADDNWVNISFEFAEKIEYALESLTKPVEGDAAEVANLRQLRGEDYQIGTWEYDVLTSAISLIESMSQQIAELESESKALSIIIDNCLDHHTPYMACIPREEWSKAMKLLEVNGE